MAVKSSVPYCVNMSVDEWIDIPSNPRQRDTQQHAKKALKKHLRQYSPTHVRVQAAALDGDILCKIDGHTRAFLWSIDKLERPPRNTVFVDVFEVSSFREAAELYTHFDSQSACENSSDRMLGACNENGLSFTSGMLKRRTIKVALQLATSGTSTPPPHSEYELVRRWRDELSVLDSWQLPEIHGALISLALLLIATENDINVVRDFFEKVVGDMGNKSGVHRDGVQALCTLLEIKKLRRQTAGWQNIIDLCRRGYTCFRYHRDGKMVSKTPVISDIHKIALKAATKKDSTSWL